MAGYYDPKKNYVNPMTGQVFNTAADSDWNQSLPEVAAEKASKGLGRAKAAVSGWAERTWYPKREDIQQQQFEDAIEQERRNILANDARIGQEKKAAKLAGLQTETAKFDENGNLVVTPGGDAGQPGVLSYYAPSDAKFTNKDNVGRIDFGQGSNFAEFDTSTPSGKAAAQRIYGTLQEHPEFYRQSKKYVNDRGDAMPFTNDMDARTYAAQGGGSNFAADPQSTLRARLDSYARASELINQTRAVARDLDPRLANKLDKYGQGTLRAASNALKQQDADPMAFNEQMMLKRAGLRQAAGGGAPKAEDVAKANLDFYKMYYPPDVAMVMARNMAAKGLVARNPFEAAAFGEQWQRQGGMLPPQAGANANRMGIRPLSVDIPSAWRFWVDPSADVVTEGGQVATVPMSKEDALILDRQLKARDQTK